MSRMFDPETGEVIDADALRSIGVLGRRGPNRPPESATMPDGTHRVELVHDGDGSTAGYDVHHPSGSDRDGIVDRVLTPPPIDSSVFQQQPGGSS